MRPNYKEIAAEMSTIALPKAEWKWIAYKEGNVYYYDTREQASSVSKLIERIQVNVEEYQQTLDLYAKQQQLIYETWWNKVLIYFGDYSLAEIDIMYDYAYDRAHAYGYDEVFGYMEDFCSIVDRFRELYK